MKRGLKIVFVLSIFLILGLSLVSAGLFNKNRITGKAITPSCVFTSANWNITNATEGQMIRLYVTGDNCVGKEISFVILERDGLFNSDDPVRINPKKVNFSILGANGIWKAEWQSDIDGGQTNPPEYYFTANTSNAYIRSSITNPGLLSVSLCVSENNTAFCSRLRKNCGSVSGTDNCGASKIVNCGNCTTGYFCNAGKCILPCVDNDSGLNFYKYGNISGPDEDGEGNPSADYCWPDRKGLMEGYCNSRGYVNFYSYNCTTENKICFNGACIVPPKCADSDGGLNYYTRGTVMYTYGGLSFIANDKSVVIDYCSGSYINEAYCFSDSSGISQFGWKGATCKYGCFNGACKKVLGLFI